MAIRNRTHVANTMLGQPLKPIFWIKIINEVNVKLMFLSENDVKGCITAIIFNRNLTKRKPLKSIKFMSTVS